MIDFLFLLLTVSAAAAGYRKGFARDILQTLIWLPLFSFGLGFMVEALSLYGPQMAMKMMWTLIGVFIASYLLAWFFDIFFFQPYFSTYKRRATFKNKVLGALLGGSKPLFAFVLTLALTHAVDEKETEQAQLKESIIVRFVKPITNNVSEHLENVGLRHTADAVENLELDKSILDRMLDDAREAY